MVNMGNAMSIMGMVGKDGEIDTTPTAEKLDFLEMYMNMQFIGLDMMSALKEYDKKYATEHPEEAAKLPPIEGSPEWYEKFLTIQYSAMRTVMSYIARHKPRLEAEAKKNKEQEALARKHNETSKKAAKNKNNSIPPQLVAETDDVLAQCMAKADATTKMMEQSSLGKSAKSFGKTKVGSAVADYCSLF